MSRLRFLLGLMREHVWSYLAGTVMLGATLWMGFAIPRYLQQAIDVLRADPDPSGATFLDRIAWILVFAVAMAVTRTGSRLLFFIPGRRVEYDLKNRLLAHLLRLQRGFYLRNPTGAIISRLNNDINGVRMLLGFGLMGLFNSLGTLSLAPYYMYVISPRLTLYCTVPIVAGFILLQVGVHRLRREQLRQMKAMQGLSDFTVESYNGIDVLKSYRAFAWAEERFGALSGAVRDSAIRMSTVRAYLMPLLSHLVNGLKILLVFVGGMLVIEGGMTIGEFAAYGLYLSMLVPPLMGMTFMLFVLQRGMTGLVSLLEVLDTKPDLPPVVPAAEARLPERLRVGLAVKDLAYAYPDDPDHPVLEGISFTIAPGEIVGLFGAVGSGKTTLVNNLNRYLIPPPGAITLDGVDITGLRLETLRRHVVTVTQEPFLFSDTVRENIAFAAEEVREETLRRVVRAAALESDLGQIGSGLETLVGEKGITLSGGQKQRIALARSMLEPCDLLILDDVLSAVDHETERHLIEQIYRFVHARATLIVSHRISALVGARRIIVLEEGRVTGLGPHRELVARPGPYRDAWRLQSDAPSGPRRGRERTR